MPHSTAELLAALDPLTHHARMSALAGHARRLAATGDLPAVLADLTGGDAHQRFLGLTMAVIVGDQATVRAGFSDPDRRLRAVAVTAYLRSGWADPDEVAALLHDAPADLRRAAYRTLRAARRADLADALIDPVRARFGDGEAAVLLPACGADTVARLLPELSYAVVNGAALARRHPTVLLDFAQTQLAARSRAARDTWWSEWGRAVLHTAQRHPTRVFDLLERYAPTTSLPGATTAYGVLTGADPARTLRLLTAPARAGWLRRQQLPSGLLYRLRDADLTDLVPLGVRLRGTDRAFARLLAALAPARRGELYDAVTADVDTADVLLSEQLLTVLPRHWQHREVRRILDLDRVRASEDWTLTYTAFLPWAEAESALVAAARRADATARGTGYALLLAAAGRSGDPAAVAAVVEQLRRLRNDQDPVRARAFTALSQVVGLLTPATVPALTDVVTQAVAARDTSSASLTAIGGLAGQVLRRHAADPALVGWAMQTFDTLYDGQQLPFLGRLDQVLRRGQERDLFDRIAPWIEGAAARDRFEPLFAVAWSLGRRAWRLPHLQRLLRRAIHPGVVSAVFRRAVTLWLADPTTRADRVGEVLAVDVSTVEIHEVWQAICTRRTDLLDEVFTTPPGKRTGKFLSAGARWVPGPAHRVARWLPRHQQAYADLLASIAADRSMAKHHRVRAISCAAPVPGAGWAVVARYLDAADVTLAEAALAALAWTDRPDEALPVLLRHVDDDRARVAVYAAGRTARLVAPSTLVAMLTDVALGAGKVTSRKQALRLLARFGPPEAFDVVTAAYQRVDQHPDVRAAAVAAARQRPDVPASWAILAGAAGVGRPDSAAPSRAEVSALLDAPPSTIAEPDRPRYAALVVAAASNPDPEAARLAWAALPAWARWAPELTELTVAALTDLDDPHRWASAMRVVIRLLDESAAAVAVAADGSPPAVDRSPLVAAVAALARLDRADDRPGDPAWDRPAHRRLDRVVDAAVRWCRDADPETDRTAVRAAARTLAGFADLTPQAARLLTHLVPLAAPTATPVAAELTALADLVADRPVLAGRLAETLTDQVRRAEGSWEPAVLVAVVGALAERGDLAGGLFAVALVRAGDRYGWSPPWRSPLHRLRRHPVPDVRSAALDIAMASG
ncbi:hypothetical protein O7543_00960 [Solwaraspora sp. WMMA2080]|uniref:hypothetical protein n=1 Tax=unclassified Solwaraspora TaxID=2627926 RepID=UPI00248C0B1C|nr:MULTISPECIES: hypothetical protein [unclassified Solwaraspora]WBB95005.1 hypothetical protein O7553_16415 [Solwaraspora sp. WMMA2059]WBC21112.1 hypothetical protein O7543_00960 [Solwaraspora sp. WMMA2080]